LLKRISEHSELGVGVAKGCPCPSLHKFNSYSQTGLELQKDEQIITFYLFRKGISSYVLMENTQQG